MFSYADIRRGEISLALSDLGHVEFFYDRWITVGDVFRSVVTSAEVNLTEEEAWLLIQRVFWQGWEIPASDLAGNVNLFAGGLELDHRGFFRDAASVE